MDEKQNNESSNNTIKNNSISNINLSKIENDYLFQLNQLKIDIENKIKEDKKSNENSINQLKEKFSYIESINQNLKESLAKINVKLDQYNELEAFKKKAESQLITHEIRINNTISDLKESKYKYDKIFIDNLSVPGFIGPQAKYKTIGEYLYNNIQSISSLNAIKEQIRKDIKEIKVKIETINKEILTIVNNAEQRCNFYSDNKCRLVENEYISENKIMNDKIMDIRINNVKEAINLATKTKELQEEWNKIVNIKKEIEKKLIEHLFIYKTNETNAINNYNEAKSQFDKVKKRFGDLVYFIKNIIFRNNMNVKKREVNTIVDKLNDLDNNDSSDSDDSRILDLDYNFKTGKILKNQITSDEEEFLKKKKVRKLFRKLTHKHHKYDKNNLNDNNLKTISQNSHHSSIHSIFNNENNNNQIEEGNKKKEKLIKKSSITSPDKYNKISVNNENKFDFSDDDKNNKNYNLIKSSLSDFKKLIERRKSVNINKKAYDIENSNLIKRCESSKTKSNFIKNKSNVKYKLNNQINNKKNVFSENEEEEFEMNSLDLENKEIHLVKIKKSHKSCDSIKKISSISSRHSLKEKKKIII